MTQVLVEIPYVEIDVIDMIDMQLFSFEFVLAFLPPRNGARQAKILESDKSQTCSCVDCGTRRVPCIIGKNSLNSLNSLLLLQ